MKTQRKLFLISLIAVAAVGIVFAIAFFSTDNRVYDQYEIAFRDSVSGLSAGASVQFNGINKGEVRELWIDPDDPALVIARIIVHVGTPVKTDTVVRREIVGETRCSHHSIYWREQGCSVCKRCCAKRHSANRSRIAWWGR